MLAPSQRHNKRSRSPASSEISDYSPAFDGFLKRRKRADLVDPFWSEQPHLDGQPSFHHPDDHHDVAESSSSPWTPQVGIERRRARQWQRLNAPLRSTSTTFSNNSQPPACPVQQSSSPVLMRLGNPQHEPAAYSHPRMSSSPVQHRPPGSSPFWETSEMPDEECMDPDDMRREWGEEYAAQNSLLHSLHLARTSTTPTPDTTRLSTPKLPSPYPYPENSSHLRPAPTPYRSDHYPFSSSSPYPPYDTADDEDESMGIDAMVAGGYDQMMEDEVGKKYEETNRLLGELEVVRRRRWEEHGSK